MHTKEICHLLSHNTLQFNATDITCWSLILLSQLGVPVVCTGNLQVLFSKK